MYWAIVILILCLLVFMIWASADVGSNVYVKTICCAHTNEKHIAITFDDGPDAEVTPRVLDVLLKYNVKATFFLIGNNVVQYPDIVKRIVAEGHVIGNHSHFHRFTFPLKSYNAILDEMNLCNNAVFGIIGKKPLLFRPPFGVTNPPISKAIKKMGFECVGWSIRSLDTVSIETSEKVFNRVCKKLHNGAILLLHDRCPNADVLLDKLINEILNKGYQIVPLNKLLNIESYEN